MLDSGTVTIVVPVYNTERYLRAALDSIRLQRYWDLEVILVDDGSSDGSTRIAEHMCAMDDRFRLIRTNRRGPGGARNAGIALASGTYLAFVDGDDIIPIGAIARLVASLRTSQSEFAVGAFEHLRGTERWRSPWVQQEHGRSLQRRTLEDVPGITRNVFPWNKLFDRAFFLREVGSFPEGTLYEDQVPTARAFVAASAFDVLQETVYLWRQRESGDSITQNRSTVEHLHQRINVLTEVDAIYAGAFPKTVHRDWLFKTLNEDLMPFIEVADQGSDDYREQLSLLITTLWQRLTAAEQQRARAHHNAPVVLAAMARNYEEAFRLLTG